jgi:arylsulfatase A-like enzyme
MKYNIIFVLLDGSRWDRLSKSKEFTNLKDKGFLLNNVTAAYPYTFGAINAIFTGFFGKENGVDAYYNMFKLKDTISTIPEILKNNGYFTACDLISDKVISKRGFDIHQCHNEHEVNLSSYHPKLIKDVFRKAKNKPVFMFLQFSKIHLATVTEILKKYEWDNKEFYKLKKENLERYDKAFIEAGKYAVEIDKTIKDLKQKEKTILVFFADHGTGIGERFGERNYGVYTFEETIRTFYLFMGPKIRKSEISDKLLSSVDLFPTILELCNLKNNFDTQGKSFAKILQSEKEVKIGRGHTFSETGGLQGPYPSPKEPNVFCMKTKRFKLIYFKTPKKWKLFDLKKDPQEKSNLIGKNMKEETKMKKTLKNWIER